MTYAKRTDKNLKEIVKAFRQLGCSVVVTNAEFDLVVGINSFNLLIEVKDGSKSPSRVRLTEYQSTLHSSWRGTIHIVKSIDEVIALVNQFKKLPTVKIMDSLAGVK